MRKIRKGKFLKVVCPKCRSKQIIFGKASVDVKCPRCGCRILKTSGGKAKVRAPVKEVLWS